MSGLVFALPAAAFYLFGGIRQWLSLRGQYPTNRRIVLLATMVAALLHLGYLGSDMLVGDYINFALLEVGSFISWIITLLLIFSSFRKPVDNLFIGLLPMSAVILLAASFSHQQVPLQNVEQGLAWHILLSILAYSVFVIASVQAILLILQNRSLKQHHMRGLVRSLPPLQTMDNLLFEMIWLGILLLSAAFVVGFPYIEDLQAQHLLHKVVFASLGWSVFALLLVGRYRFGWRGVMASRWTLTGMAFLILSYFGSKFVLEVLLGKA